MDLFSEYQTDTIDLGLNFYGYEDCESNYSFGPAIRDAYILHYIKKGSGRFHYQGKIIDLQAGDLFLLKPNELTFYQADSQNPWSYYWLGITGAKAEDYFKHSQIIEDCYIKTAHSQLTKTIETTIEDLVYFAEKTKSDQLSQLHILGQLYELMFHLGTIAYKETTNNPSPSQQLYLDCKKIIDTQYPNPHLSIQQIAADLSVHRSYLTTVFKEYQNSAPKEYLHKVRMERGKKLLETTNQPVKFIAYSVGFSDPLYFSKAFKNYFHSTPSKIRSKSYIY